MKKQQNFYMHVETGTVESYGDWVLEISEEELEESGKESAVELIESYISRKILCKVEANDNGDWVEA